MGRDTIVTFRDHEDKENGKDQNWKPVKIRSPMGSKGTRNFMSPTISAASKISPSPRKKILAERNEPLRKSVSFSDTKIPSFSQTIGHSEREEEVPTSPANSKASNVEETYDSKQPLGSNSEPDLLPQTVSEEPHGCNVTQEPDSVNLDPSFKISPPASSSFPLDSGPSAPPYDPKKNYLSPRPQFLLYRPNPRVGFCLSEESEGNRLEDTFVSGSFSDTDATEETQSEYSQKELDDVSSSEVLNAEEKPEEEEQQEEGEELHVSQETVKSDGQPKPRFFWKKKLVVLLVVLSLACLSFSAINSPVVDPSMFEEATFSKLYDNTEIADFVKVSFTRFHQNLRGWYAKSVSFLSELISNLRGETKLGTLHYYNLTALLEDVQSSGYMAFDHGYEGREGNSEVKRFGATRGIKVQIENFEEKALPDVGHSEEILPGYEEQMHQEAEPFVGHIKLDSEEVEATVSESVEASQERMLEAEAHQAPEAEVDEPQESDLAGSFFVQTESITNRKDDPILNSQSEEVQPEIFEAGELQDQSETSSGAEVEPPKEEFFSSENPEVDEASHKNAPTLEVVDLTVNGSPENASFKVNVLGIVSLFLSLIAGTIIIYVNRRKSAALSNASNPASQPPVTKKMDCFFTNPVKPADNTFQERPASWNWREESCPSEMSSFGKSSSSYSKKASECLNKAESQEKKTRKNNDHRRESLASSSLDSSMGSPSYGSFTTYEKIPSKHVSI